MARVAARAPLPSHQFDKVGSGAVSKATTAVKRKTPSELRVSFCLLLVLVSVSRSIL